MNRLLLAALFLPALARAISWQQAVADPTLTLTIRGDCRSHLSVQVANRAAAAVKIELPAGLVGAGKNGNRAITIRSATLEIPAGKIAEADLPAVALSWLNKATEQEFAFNLDSIPALTPLIDYSARQNDLPRTTAQIAALLLLENITFEQSLEFLYAVRSETPKSAATEVTTCVDAVAIVREVDPKRKLAILDDGQFRLWAIRSPKTRAKAMELFGLDTPEGVPVPTLNELLHTGPGDNCPICRMRAQSADPTNGL